MTMGNRNCEVHMSARPLQGELLSSFPSCLFRGIEQINDKINLNIEKNCGVIELSMFS